MHCVPPTQCDACATAAHIARLLSVAQHLVVIDYTAPSCVHSNAEARASRPLCSSPLTRCSQLYARCRVPFVMGTTGGDREKLVRSPLVSASLHAPPKVADAVAAGAYAVIAPQMGIQLAAFQVYPACFPLAERAEPALCRRRLR